MKKNIDVRKLKFISEDVHSYYDAMSAGLHLISHDLGGSLAAKDLQHLVLKDQIIKMKELVEKEDFEGLKEKINIALEMCEFAGLEKEKISRMFHILIGSKFDYGMVTIPGKIIPEIAIALNTKIAVSESVKEDLEVAFPANIWGGLSMELAKNASKAGATKIYFDYYINNNFFVLEVHDDGPGIIESLSQTPVKFFELFKLKNIKKKGGLDIIGNLIYQLGGQGECRTSKYGGTLFCISFPIKAYFLEGILYDLTK